MRIALLVKVPEEPIPFDHQHLLAGTVYKWLGNNGGHGEISLYSFSRLQGARQVKSGLLFNEGASFFFSAHEPEVVKRLVNGIMADKSMFYGIEVREIHMIQDPDFMSRELFYPASPIFIKRYVNDDIEHILYDNPDAGRYLKETLLTKMAKAGIVDETLDISFDLSYRRAGSKMVDYKGIKNKTSWCPVIIKGKPETKLFAWNVGLGNSTGIGLGAIR